MTNKGIKKQDENKYLCKKCNSTFFGESIAIIHKCPNCGSINTTLIKQSIDDKIKDSHREY